MPTLKNKTPEELAALFPKHHIRPRICEPLRRTDGELCGCVIGALAIEYGFDPDTAQGNLATCAWACAQGVLGEDLLPLGLGFDAWDEPDYINPLSLLGQKVGRIVFTETGSAPCNP